MARAKKSRAASRTRSRSRTQSRSRSQKQSAPAKRRVQRARPARASKSRPMTNGGRGGVPSSARKSRGFEESPVEEVRPDDAQFLH